MVSVTVDVMVSVAVTVNVTVGVTVMVSVMIAIKVTAQDMVSDAQRFSRFTFRSKGSCQHSLWPAMIFLQNI